METRDRITGDIAGLRAFFGLSPGSPSYPCLWCENKRPMNNYHGDWEEGGALRSPQSFLQHHQDLVAAGPLAEHKDFYSCEHAPFFVPSDPELALLPMHHLVAPPSLHLKLNLDWLFKKLEPLCPDQLRAFLAKYCIQVKPWFGGFTLQGNDCEQVKIDIQYF